MIPKCLTIGALLLAFCCLGPVANSRADLIVNGSFESSTAGLPDHWNPVGNLKVISSQGETDGSYALAFSFGNVPSTGSISQTLATTAATTYWLTFDFGKYSISQPNQTARLQVDVFDGQGFGGSQLLNQLVSDSTPGPGDPNSTDSPAVYSAFQCVFTAQSASSTLRFTDLSDAQVSGGGFDAMLDNVDVSVVPEPSSFLCLLCAFGALVFWRRSWTATA